jgi:hypothetical protein
VYLLDAVLTQGLELAVNRVDPPLYRFHLLPGRICHPFQLLQIKLYLFIYAAALEFYLFMRQHLNYHFSVQSFGGIQQSLRKHLGVCRKLSQAH